MSFDDKNVVFIISKISKFWNIKDIVMAKCEVCGKSVQFGNNVSHSNKKTRKMWRPNVKKIRVLENKSVVRKNICTSCIKSGKIQKAV